MSSANTGNAKAIDYDFSDAPKSRSLWQDARIRFLQNKASVVSLYILAVIVLFAIFGNFFAQWTNEEIDWTVLGKVPELGAPSIANGHYFGVDELGRDLYARMVQATRVSLMVAVVASLISMTVGVVIGAVAAWFGGRVEVLIMRFVDILIAVPYLIVYIVVMAVAGRTLINLLLTMGLMGWTTATLITRGQVLMLKNREFIDAAKVLGLSNFQILTRHIFPNLIGIIVIYTSITMPETIMAESLLSFLGMGIQEPNTSWGVLISEGASTMQFGALWQFFIPFTFFAITMMALYYIGDGLRDAFDPKDR